MIRTGEWAEAAPLPDKCAAGVAKFKNRDSRLHEAVPVYCDYRLIENNRMICCNTCSRWYHGSCIVVPPQVWNLGLQHCCWPSTLHAGHRIHLQRFQEGLQYTDGHE